MTDREKKIAEIREGYKSDKDDSFTYKKEIVEKDIQFLLSELDREEECTQKNPCKMCLRDSVEGYKNIVQELEEENRKLREEREKLIEGLRLIYTDTEDGITSSYARKLLKSIGIEV